MAPTLQGRHKDVRCPECGYRYQAGASADAENQYGEVDAVTCPACHFDQELDPRNASDVSNTGDRILVNKFAYEPPFGEPERWDVIVFKYPGNAKQNYIKRCVGLEKEIIKIHHGDIYVQKTNDDGSPAEADFHIARKPPRKLLHMMQLVHDTRYLSSSLQQVDWPLNWQTPDGGQEWTSPDQGRTYVCSATDNTAWLEFRQYYLDHSVWDRLAENVESNAPPLEGIKPLEAPVTDFYAYNAQTRRLDARGMIYQQPDPLGMHWVGDLAVEADLEVVSDSGQIDLVLVEAGRQHTCRIDVATGRASMQIDDGRVPFEGTDEAEVTQVTTETPIHGAGRYQVRFANVDNQLLLWVNNKLCTFDHDTAYGPTLSDRPETGPDDAGDMHPVRLGVRGAEVEVRRLRVLRDIYYIATNSDLGTTTDYPRFDEGQRIIQHLVSPQRWKPGDLFDHRNTVLFTMAKDQFFALGDNSPYSRDGRLWGTEHYVDRDLLIGKAVMIYWPHAWRIGIPGTGMSLPLIPNIQNMGLIH